MSLNVCTFTGRLGKDCESRSTTGGDTVTSFTLAVDVGWGDKKSTLWLRCNGWGKRYEAVAPYLTKGQSVGVSGELSNREWTDKEGEKKTSLELRLVEVALLGAKQEGKAESKPAAAESAGDGWDEGTIPF